MPRRSSRRSKKKKHDNESISSSKKVSVEPCYDDEVEESEDRDSCFVILCEEKTRPLIDQLINRKFFVSKSYKDKVIYSTDKYIDAVRHCPNGYLIFDSEGIKIFPPPVRKTTIKSLYSIKKNRKETKNYGSYRELQEAINNCPIGYSIYDEDGNKVY